MRFPGSDGDFSVDNPVTKLYVSPLTPRRISSIRHWPRRRCNCKKCCL